MPKQLEIEMLEVYGTTDQDGDKILVLDIQKEELDSGHVVALMPAHLGDALYDAYVRDPVAFQQVLNILSDSSVTGFDLIAQRAASTLTHVYRHED